MNRPNFLATHRSQYIAAQLVTEAAKAKGLVRHAAALARQIRWSPDDLTRLHYPIGMELATTCCCHVVVDDPNFSDDIVASCLSRAIEQRHPDCIALATLLMQASKIQRKRINHLAWFED